MKKIIVNIALILTTALLLMFGDFRIFAEDCEEVQSEVLRLHIPANSDSEEDQAVKLELRDYLLSEYGTVLSECSDLSEAEKTCEKLLPEIEAKCNEFLKSRGFSYGAKAELTEMYFTTREYDKLILPAGQYKALRVTLGSGEGHNWWCVIFPQLCLPAAMAAPADNTEQILDSFGKPQKIEIRFAIYEWIKQLFS